MPELNKELVTAIKRKWGEENLTIISLSKQTNVSRWTLNKILSGERTNVQTSTITKLNNWLYTFM